VVVAVVTEHGVRPNGFEQRDGLCGVFCGCSGRAGGGRVELVGAGAVSCRVWGVVVVIAVSCGERGSRFGEARGVCGELQSCEAGGCGP
jgi:hypothetical protein